MNYLLLKRSEKNLDELKKMIDSFSATEIKLQNAYKDLDEMIFKASKCIFNVNSLRGREHDE